MLYNNLLNHIFNSAVTINILRELRLRQKGVTGRETARLTGITHRSALNALHNLELLKVVKKEPVGKAYYFTLNRDHFLYQNIIEPALNTERQYKQALFELIKKELKKYCESLIVFGSVARGSETITSDFDLCIIYKTNRREIESKLSDLRIKAADSFGVTLAPLFLSAKEIQKENILNKPLIRNIADEGKVIFGKTIEEIIDG